MKKLSLTLSALLFAGMVQAAPPAISGDISSDKVIPLLYGHASVKIDDVGQFTLWRNIQLPKSWKAEELPIEIGNDGLLVAEAFEQKYNEGGKEKYILLTQALNRDWVLEGGGCHPCAPIIGAAIFAKNGGQWTLEAENKFVDTLGSFGHFGGEVKLMQIGPQKHGLLHEGGYMMQGCISTYFFIFMPHKGSIESFGVGESKELCEGMGDDAAFRSGDYDVSLRFDTASQGEYYDAVLQYKSAREGSKPVTVTEKYRFNGSEYKPF